MLRIADDVRWLQVVARKLCVRLRSVDGDLERQLRRSAQSVALNLAEGAAARGGRRRSAYEIAMREAKECKAAFEVAADWGYIETDEAVADRLDKIVATLYRLNHPKVA